MAAPTIMPGGIRYLRSDLQSRLKPEMSTTVAMYDANIYPFTHLMRMINSQTIYREVINWTETDQVPEWDTVHTGTQDPTATTFLVHFKYYLAGDLLYVPRTGEQIRVVTMNANGTTIDVCTRGVGSTAGTLNDNEPIFKIGESFAEGTGAPASVITELIERYNYTKIVKKTIEGSETARVIQKWTGDDRARDRMLKLKLIKMEMEKAALFEKKSSVEDPTTHKTIQTLDGICSVIQTNRIDMTGVPAAPVNKSTFRSVIKDAFRFSTSKRLLLLGGSTIIDRVDSFAEGALVTRPLEETWGTQVNRYVTTFGELNLVNHYLLTGTVFGGYAILVDLSLCHYCPLTTRDVHLIPDIQLKSEDTYKDMWLGEFTFKFEMEKAHTLMYNIS